jgi:hypothetical protein
MRYSFGSFGHCPSACFIGASVPVAGGWVMAWAMLLCASLQLSANEAAAPKRIKVEAMRIQKSSFFIFPSFTRLFHFDDRGGAASN